MLTKQERLNLAIRIKDEQESFHHQTIGELTFPTTHITYSYNDRLERAQGLNSCKSNSPICTKAKQSINESITRLTKDEQLQFWNTKKFHNHCSYYIMDASLNEVYNFEITITPPYNNHRIINDILCLTKISFKKAQWYINPQNRHRLIDTSTLPQIEINLCKEDDTYYHLHITIKKQTIREFKTLLYFLFFIFKAKHPSVDIEYHNLICRKAMDEYVKKQVEQTLFTKDVFGEY